MRILSQDGFYDVPYEAIAIRFSEDDGTVIIGVPLSLVAEDLVSDIPVITLGIYSTEAKARKAMEMLQKAYSPVFVMKEQTEGIMPNLKPNNWIVVSVPTPKLEVMDNFYFQFPADDEVEV